MEALLIRVNKNAQPAAYDPKFNFAFYKQTRDDKELKGDYPDGFSALVDGLLNESVDAIVAAYFHSLAWYKRNQPSIDAVEEALEANIFASDEATDQAFKDILDEMKKDDFLTRRLKQFIKDQNKNADMAQKQMEAEEDESKRQQLSLGLEQITEEINKLKSLLASNESSPKPEDVDSHPQN